MLRTNRPLQNRVDPFGALHAVAARGTIMGNRGGRFHKSDRTLGQRRFVSRRWISCLCEFRDRRREVWGDGYTELFFLDEVTALAAGHRPCFECRREDATAFAAAFPEPGGKGNTAPKRVSAETMDLILHFERMAAYKGARPVVPCCDLPDGTMIAIDGRSYAIKNGRLLAWDFTGYADAGSIDQNHAVTVLTPASTLGALHNGYRPNWHASADGVV